jgi:hypothetical protein
LETVKPITWGRGEQDYVVCKGNMNRTKSGWRKHANLTAEDSREICTTWGTPVSEPDGTDRNRDVVLVLEIIEPEVSAWSGFGDILAIRGEIEGQCNEPGRACQRGMVSGEVGIEAIHTETRGEVAPAGDTGHGRQAAANSGSEDTGSDIRADIQGRELWL